MRLNNKSIIIAIFLAFIITGCTGAKVEPPGKEQQLQNQEERPTIENNPIVTIEMENGDVIKAELYPNEVYNTVVNFVTLIEQGFYDGLIFHRVIPGFMIQGGDPQGNGRGGPGYNIPGEFAANGIRNDIAHVRGILSMARSQHPDSAGSQFFIMVDTATHLDGNYAAFGKVIEGMEAVDKIVNTPTTNERPQQDQRMQKVTVETFGIDYGEPIKN